MFFKMKVCLKIWNVFKLIFYIFILKCVVLFIGQQLTNTHSKFPSVFDPEQIWKQLRTFFSSKREVGKVKPNGNLNATRSDIGMMVNVD